MNSLLFISPYKGEALTLLKFRMREFRPMRIFLVKLNINLVGGTKSYDDTVIDKPHSDPRITELKSYYYSGRDRRAVKGIQLITLYYTDLTGKSVPVNYRIYNKQEGKTKNDYLPEMITEVLDWGLKPKTVTTDTWYSSQENLKFLKNKQLGFLTGIAKNRSGSVDGKNFTSFQNLEISESGLIVYLKKFAQLKVFQRNFKNETSRYYIMYTPEKDALSSISRTEFRELHSIHWGIECYHRAIKLCGIGRFMVRATEAIKTHFFSARSFTQLELIRSEDLIENWYELQRNLSLQVAREFILEHLTQKLGESA